MISLGKMGANIALHVVERGIKMVGKARGQKPELTQKRVMVVEGYKNFLANLKPPRSIFLSPPGEKLPVTRHESWERSQKQDEQVLV